jgi:hypothetical protein
MDTAGTWGRAALVVLSFAGAASASAPARVHACSCIGFGIIRSTPLHDATDVPIDVAPVISGSFDPDELSFERADGTPVDFEVRAGHGGNEPCVVVSAELVPAQVLDIETQYVIRTQSVAFEAYPPHAVRFTTGSDRVPEVALEAPAVAAAFANYGGSCGTITGCIRIDGAEQTEVVLHAEGAEPVLLFANGAEQQLRGFFELPACIEVRARDAAGRRSEATMLCSDGIATRDAMGSFGAGALCPESVGHDEMTDTTGPGATTGGCAATASSGGTSWHSLLLALLAVLLRVRCLGLRSMSARRPHSEPSGGIRARFDVAALTTAAALLGGAGAMPSPAHACSCAPLAIEWSEPTGGAVGVPIDIAPILSGWFDPARLHRGACARCGGPAFGRDRAVRRRFVVRDTRESDYEEYELRCENGVIGEGDVEAMESRDAGPDDDTPDGGPRSDDRRGSRTEVDMSRNGCSASGSSAGRAGTHALLLAVLLGLRLRARYRNV